MNEIIASVSKWFKDRTTSPLYGTFIFSVILWNWRFFYILFWESSDRLPWPKIEYVQNYILSKENLWVHLFHFLILPAISTYIIIWWLPILSTWAHRKHIEFYYGKKSISDKARLKYEEKETATLESISEVKKQQVEVKKEIQKNTTDEEKWTEEFESSINKPSYNKMSQLIEAVYNHSGKTQRYVSNLGNRRIVEPDMLASAHTRGLIKLVRVADEEIIELTEKGKFFVKKYLENK